VKNVRQAYGQLAPESQHRVWNAMVMAAWTAAIASATLVFYWFELAFPLGFIIIAGCLTLAIRVGHRIMAPRNPPPTNPPIAGHEFSLPTVLLQEYEHLHGPLPEGAPRPSDTKRIYSTLIHQLPHGQSALCFSGGGIRSAAFNLGVLQGLASCKLLHHFHYLSTVSGGGYIGSWLSAWIHHTAQARATGAPQAVAEIETALADEQTRITNQELTFIRRYRNYLSPNWHLLSADTWTLIATYLRNLFFTWLVLLTFLLGLLALPRLLVSLIQNIEHPMVVLGLPVNFDWPLWMLATVATVLSIGYITASVVDATPYSPDQSERWRQRFVWFCLLPLTLASLSFCLHWAWKSVQAHDAYTYRDFIVFAIAVHFYGVLAGKVWMSGHSEAAYRLSAKKLTVWILTILASSWVSGSAAWTASKRLFPSPHTTASAYVVFCPPLLLIIFLLGADVLVALVSRWTTDEHREWKARLNAFVLRGCAIWMAVCGLVLLGPIWLAELPYPDLLASVGGLSGFVATILGFSRYTRNSTANQDAESGLHRAGHFSVTVLAPIGLLFLVMSLTWLTNVSLVTFFSKFHLQDCVSASDLGGTFVAGASLLHQCVIRNTPLSLILAVVAACIAISVFMSWFVDINKFSLHCLYRDRLIRTFLGASNPNRHPNWFTDFDPKDNLEMHALAAHRGPLFHVVNVAVNLLSSRDYAWQDRKAASFTISPLHCGSMWPVLGYRDSRDYGRSQARGQSITLGTALAISGAAASPNMGYHSSAAVTFLMTLFNARLGWWLGNTGPAGDYSPRFTIGEAAQPTWKRSTPRFSLIWWIKEALGQTREDNKYVYLSDGGHFENLGLYEMVLRRCRYIVVSDAGCDLTYSLEDLGNALRKIRIDLGIEVEIDLDMLKPEAGQRYGRWHHAIGVIRYDKVDDNAPVGILLYLKASLTGDESPDVLEYATAHRDFPHDTTSDQFFTEAQFESYRMLGEHVAREVLKPAATVTAGTGSAVLGDVLHKLRASWLIYPPGIKDSFLKTTASFLALEAKLRSDPHLSRLDAEIYPELETILGGPALSDIASGESKARLHFCMQAIQLMEDVFIALNLGVYHAHPLNSGWMNFFRRLAAGETLKKLWPSIKSSFSKDFIDFAEYQLNFSAYAAPEISEQPLDGTLRIKLVEEFKEEWPRDHYRATRERFERMLNASEGSVLISALPPHRAPGKIDIWGVAGAYRCGDEVTYELNVWVRGAYRGVGIGTTVLAVLLERIQARATAGDLILQVHLPALQPDRPGYAMEKAGWLEFFLRKQFVLQEETAEHYLLRRIMKRNRSSQ
jgi:GNAT superfamily N-acetyltransferase